MSILDAIESFIRRRVQIDVGPTDIVLDVGSGDKPHWRADVLLEKYSSASFAHQRSEGGPAVIDRCMVGGDVENIPFRDKAFDYVICSHVLEHVEHPDRAICELQRVGKRGYIEVPFEGMQKLDDFPSHLWYIHSEDDRLVFTAKQERVFDPYIGQLMPVLVNAGIIEKFQSYHFDECIVTKYWQDQILYEIRGKLPERFIQDIMHLSGSTATSAFIPKRKARSLFFALVRLAYRRKVRRVKIDIASLLRCCECGSESFTSVSGGFICSICGKLIMILN